MLIKYECDVCGLSYDVSRMDKELHLLSIRMPCPGFECNGGVQVVNETAEPPKKLTARVLYEACMGRGFPEERYCSPEALEKLLVNSHITSVQLKEVAVDEDRSIIESMTVDTGDYKITLHFAMSNHGATIYKAIKEESNG
jgi:hypothetical protein